MDDPSHDSLGMADIGSPGEVGAGITGILAEILKAIQQPLVRPSTMIVLRTTLAADSTTSIFSTHVRYHITRVLSSQAVSNPFNIVLGANAILEGISNGSLMVDAEVDFIIDPGVDVKAQTQAGAALFGAAPSTVWLIGTIIN